MTIRFRIVFILLLSVSFVLAQNDSTHISLNGQLTSWGIIRFENTTAWQLGARFVPIVQGNICLAPQSNLDFQASLNLNGSLNLSGTRFDSVAGQLNPYRIWARYSGKSWEIRVGLQQINFGSAKMFRPLMWFDGMDVRDPLQLTSGVYGALGRYYFKNNANIWLWTLIGNKTPIGFETIGSSQWKPELGGRLQMPAGTGQLALSTNFRQVDVHNVIPSVPNSTILNEKRIGLDGKWDLGIGLWFESSISMLDANTYNLPTVQDVWNIGVDYTFGIGNGLGMTVEYFRYHTANEFLLTGKSLNVVGSMFIYPVSILDNLSAMVFYIPESKLFYNYVSWGRTYDNWSIYGIAYWNPLSPLTISPSQGTNLFAGKGIELMINYNF